MDVLNWLLKYDKDDVSKINNGNLKLLNRIKSINHRNYTKNVILQ